MQLKPTKVVHVVLTALGADILNAENKRLNKELLTDTFKANYSEGDSYSTPLWNAMSIFGSYCYLGAKSPIISIYIDEEPPRKKLKVTA